MKIDKTTLEDCYLDLLDEVDKYKITSDAHVTDKNFTKILSRDTKNYVTYLKNYLNRIGLCPLEYFECKRFHISVDSKKRLTTDKIDKLCKDGNERVKLNFSCEVNHIIIDEGSNYNDDEFYYSVIIILRDLKPMGKLNEANTLSIYPKLNIEFIKSIPEFTENGELRESKIKFIWLDGEDENKFLVEELTENYATPTLTKFKTLLRSKGENLSDKYKVITTLEIRSYTSQRRLKDLAQRVQDAHPDYNIFYDTVATREMYNIRSFGKIYIESNILYPSSK
jgi:hypothetical protein